MRRRIRNAPALFFVVAACGPCRGQYGVDPYSSHGSVRPPCFPHLVTPKSGLEAQVLDDVSSFCYGAALRTSGVTKQGRAAWEANRAESSGCCVDPPRTIWNALRSRVALGEGHPPLLEAVKKTPQGPRRFPTPNNVACDRLARSARE